MDIVSLVGIAVGLAMDAFAVSVTNGAVTKKADIHLAAKIAATFGIFQAFMPFIGWLIGKAGESFISSVDHWVALILLSYLGIQMLREAYKKQQEGCPSLREEGIGFKNLMALGVATSIDALATGIILPSAVGASTLTLMLVSVSIIGIITAVLCFIGVFIGKRFGCLLSSKAEYVGGIVLIAIGIKIVIDHVILKKG